jgi:hypothetical protein
MTADAIDGPSFISIHMRRRDFKDWCGDVPVEDFFASIVIIAWRLQEVKDKLLLIAEKTGRAARYHDERRDGSAVVGRR